MTNDRCTCRDEFGGARLMPGVNLMTVIEALCRVEEKRSGKLIIKSTANSAGMHCRDCDLYDQKGHGSGLCKTRKDQNGEQLVVAGSRCACKNFKMQEEA